MIRRPPRSPLFPYPTLFRSHRGLTHEFVVVSGHVPPGHPQSLVDWAALGRLRGTVVVLMGVDTAPAIAAALVEHGRAPETPVAVVADGSTPTQRTVRTTLAGLAQTLADQDIRPPAVWVVGDVVRLTAEVGRPLRAATGPQRSEERRVGKECRSRWSPYH